MKISVTESHIKRGIPIDPNSCPVALALLEQVPQAVLATVRNFTIAIRVSAPTDRQPMLQFLQYYTHVAPEVMQFVGAFDRGEAVKPFEFELEAPTTFLLGEDL